MGKYQQFIHVCHIWCNDILIRTLAIVLFVFFVFSVYPFSMHIVGYLIT